MSLVTDAAEHLVAARIEMEAARANHQAARERTMEAEAALASARHEFARMVALASGAPFTPEDAP